MIQFVTTFLTCQSVALRQYGPTLSLCDQFLCSKRRAHSYVLLPVHAPVKDILHNIIIHLLSIISGIGYTLYQGLAILFQGLVVCQSLIDFDHTVAARGIVISSSHIVENLLCQAHPGGWGGDCLFSPLKN